MLTGQCHCGAIQYDVLGPTINRTLCHCTMCRGTTGAPCVAWFSVPRSAYTIRTGSPVYYRSSEHGTRGFCGACGTQISFADDSSLDEIDITICSLHHPEAVPIADHTFVDSALPWMVPGDALPRYRRTRSEGV